MGCFLIAAGHGLHEIGGVEAELYRLDRYFEIIWILSSPSRARLRALLLSPFMRSWLILFKNLFLVYIDKQLKSRPSGFIPDFVLINGCPAVTMRNAYHLAKKIRIALMIDIFRVYMYIIG